MKVLNFLKALIACLLSKLDRLVPRRLFDNKFGNLANQVAGVLVALFILGSIGATAVIMASNATAYGSSVPAAVKTMFTIGIPAMAAVAIMLYFIPRRT